MGSVVMFIALIASTLNTIFHWWTPTNGDLEIEIVAAIFWIQILLASNKLRQREILLKIEKTNKSIAIVADAMQKFLKMAEDAARQRSTYR